MPHHTLLFLLVLPVAGCSWLGDAPPVHPPLPPSNLDVTFVEAALQTTFSVETGEGILMVRDRTITGVCHTREKQGAFLKDELVTLWIAHTGARSDVCPAIGVPGAYEAVIKVPPGRYTMRVEYIGHIQSDTYPRPDLEVRVEVR